MSQGPDFIRMGLRKRGESIRLRMRWDRSPRTCAALAGRLPIENQIWHAKYANNEIYTLVTVIDDEPPGEWLSAYPGPGDCMYIPIPPGVVLPPGAPEMDVTRGLIDLAYFYDRGSNLTAGPSGPVIGSIFATATSIEDIERMAKVCNDVWFSGAAGETLSFEASD